MALLKETLVTRPLGPRDWLHTAYASVAELVLPRGCALVGVELLEGAVDLPSFRHPPAAAYVLGAERGALSPELAARCQHLVRIPTKFCVNVGIAGAIVMYDRITSLGRHPRRPERPGGPTEAMPEHVFGDPKIRDKMEKFRDTPPVPEDEGEG